MGYHSGWLVSGFDAIGARIVVWMGHFCEGRFTMLVGYMFICFLLLILSSCVLSSLSLQLNDVDGFSRVLEFTSICGNGTVKTLRSFDSRYHSCGRPKAMAKLPNIYREHQWPVSCLQPITHYEFSRVYASKLEEQKEAQRIRNTLRIVKTQPTISHHHIQVRCNPIGRRGTGRNSCDKAVVWWQWKTVAKGSVMGR